METRFGEVIAQKRAEKGLTQIELAEILYVARQTVSRWERGYSYPTMDTLVKLSQILDFSLDYALLGDEEMVEKVSKEQKNAHRNKRLLMVVGVFVALTVIWGIINYFQLNFRDIPPENIYRVEKVGGKVIVSVEDTTFWTTKVTMMSTADSEDTVDLSINQQLRLTNAFNNKGQTFVFDLADDEAGIVKYIKLPNSKKKIPIHRDND